MKSIRQRLEHFLLYHAYLYAAACLHEVYFYSFHLLDIVQQHFFTRFCAEFNHGQGLCYEVSSLVMLALRDCKSARIVRGIDSEDDFVHSWVEFRHFGVWYVIDPCWLNLFIARRDRYYDEFHPQVFFICNHREFWQYTICQQFRACMEHPETSYFLTDLCYPFVSDRQDERCVFDANIAAYHMRHNGSRADEMLYMAMTFKEHFCFYPRVVAEYMARPSRRRPKARTLRHYSALRKQIRCAYVGKFVP